jgi:hypothetical protein
MIHHTTTSEGTDCGSVAAAVFTKYKEAFEVVRLNYFY